MKRSTERILTTHTGSLPRPWDLVGTLEALDAGTAARSAAFEARVRQAVADVVRKQAAAGVDSSTTASRARSATPRTCAIA
jgi:5-methyltetrahydropteroyltriglutamate--homocysteine methyltransferase